MKIDQDIAHRLTELADSGLEGLEYVHQRNMEGQIEQSMPVFVDVVQAFSEIERVLADDQTNQPPELANATKSLREGLDWLVKEYESSQQKKLYEIMQLTVIPRYKQWRKELGAYLNASVGGAH